MGNRVKAGVSLDVGNLRMGPRGPSHVVVLAHRTAPSLPVQLLDLRGYLDRKAAPLLACSAVLIIFLLQKGLLDTVYRIIIDHKV